MAASPLTPRFHPRRARLVVAEDLVPTAPHEHVLEGLRLERPLPASEAEPRPAVGQHVETRVRMRAATALHARQLESEPLEDREGSREATLAALLDVGPC